MLRTQRKNARNFHFVTTRHLEEEPVLRSHKFNRLEQQKFWNLAIKTKEVMQITEVVFGIEDQHPETCKSLLVLCFY